MDNLTHTLVGAALGEAGLKRRTALAMPALLIGANLPDLDALAYLFGSSVDALAFRRGWTHGVLAMGVLPLLLCGALLLVARLRKPPAHGDPPLRPGWLLAVCAAGVWSHPLLDWLNSYGVRLLMPFSGEWFYGDALFIVDPWVLAALVGGVWLSRRAARRGERRSGAPARWALTGVAAYAMLMALGSIRAGAAVGKAHPHAERVMAGPVAVDPLRRAAVWVEDGVYVRADVRLGGGQRVEPVDTIPIRADHPRSVRAARTPDGEKFLVWSRYPFFVPGRRAVTLGDARYSGMRDGWAEVVVPVDSVGG